MPILDAVPRPRASPHPSATTCGGRECSLVRDLFTLHHLMMRTADRLSAPAGLTASRWLLLAGIAHGEGSRSVSGLAESALLSVQATSRMLAAMAKEGLIARARGRGRSLSIRLTPRGRRVFDKTGALAERFERSFFRGVARGRIEDLRRDCGLLTENLRVLETELCEESR